MSRVAGERSCQIASAASSKAAISSFSTGAPELPSTQQRPLHTIRSQQNFSVKISVVVRMLPIWTIIIYFYQAIGVMSWSMRKLLQSEKW